MVIGKPIINYSLLILIRGGMLMRSTEQRIAVMHRRARELKRRRDGTALIMYGSSCAVLFAALVCMIGQFAGETVTAGLYTGASLLDVSAGGYVLVAVIAFMLGVIITAFLIKRQKHIKDENENKGGKENETTH